MDKDNIQISVVIPVFNERENIGIVFEKLKSVLLAMGKNFEIIIVDDGSTDGTGKALEDLFIKEQRLSVYRFRRHYGKSAALSVGFLKAKGDYIVTLDGDGQDEPAEIPELINELNKGFDVISGWKYPRKDSFPKKLASWIFNFITSLVTGLKLHDMNCGLKVYRAEAIKNIRLYGELHRFILALIAWNGFKVGEKKVVHHKRISGKSKFGLRRYLEGFFDLITVFFLTRFDRRPMHLFGTVGGILFVSGLLIETYLAINWFMGRWIGQRPLLFLGILAIIVGLQLLSTGLLGEMLANSRVSAKDYVMEKILIRGEQ